MIRVADSPFLRTASIMAFGPCENLIYFASKQVAQLSCHLGIRRHFNWLPMKKRFISFGVTDIGLRRLNNEDVYLIRPDLSFCLVADGMGGAAAGEVASSLFSEAAVEIFLKNGNHTACAPDQMVQQAFELANKKMLTHVDRHPHHEGMGCTAELLVFSGEKYFLGHVGDSRTYRMRNGNLQQLTEDHSFVQEQVNRGLITPAEARKHEMRNVILRAVGIEARPRVAIHQGNAASGDLFMLCSDGLTDLVEDEMIQEIMAISKESLKWRAKKLVELAKTAGGYDNITVVLAQIE